jgi:hypothetical protein
MTSPSQHRPFFRAKIGKAYLFVLEGETDEKNENFGNITGEQEKQELMGRREGTHQSPEPLSGMRRRKGGRD